QKKNSQNRKELAIEMKITSCDVLYEMPREEITKEGEECREDGIIIVILTDNDKKNDTEIGNKLKNEIESTIIIECNELNRMSVKELSKVIEQVTVFARVTSENKLKIVKAFQSKGHIVAMTGDGVNDAPAIKASDIGISMGMTGTDVTKEASSLILMD